MAGLSDPMRFMKAEEFFSNLSSARGPTILVNAQSSQSIDPTDPLRYAALLTLDEGSTCLFQFVTPQLWRIRFDSSAKTAAAYSDANSRTIVQNSFAGLVDELQKELHSDDQAWNGPNAPPNSCWATTFAESSDASGWVLSSVRYPSQEDATAGKDGVVCIKAFFRKDPFQIQCTRVIQPQPEISRLPPGIAAALSVEKVVWQTSPTRTLLQSPQAPRATNILLNVAKPGPAKYVGFGEQGGRTVMKSETLMNYFCYDNLNYEKVYNQAALDPREPLYHSQPFFMELNATPGYQSVTATLVDNYSQVFIDLGHSDSSHIGLGVRFGILDTYIMCADKVPELIWLFTSIVGRPKLKPRFVLGHHQGGYGYASRQQLEDVVSNYRNVGIPLDSLHIDVDFQHKYRTFTADDDRFPSVADMFAQLRTKGVKCCTNITPIISFDGYRTTNDPYPTINAAWDRDDHADPSKNFLITDKRFLEGLQGQNAEDQLYMYYDSGQAQITSPSSDDRPMFNDGKDEYQFGENFNSGYPFHGGVVYGDNLGVPGFYPDLNRQVVREQFWAPQYEDLFNKGLEFVWQDMTTPAVARWYGDMLGFPARLLVSTDPYGQKRDVLPPQLPAIEIWALYSYNLHKATYKALENLPSRQNKRNFIIGRGSSTGMHRFAGLWTGDNGSTWDFWRINVAQVLALGLGGITIAGVDMGGFTPSADNGKWCDPDLFVRWYSGSFLLPWYRNHYNGKAGNKLFQEVYKFSTVQQDYPQFPIPDNQLDLYASVLPICKYYVRLRYSLMQALYDRMFENLINGLPIARSMLITDPDDTALLEEAAAYVDNQYLLGHYILVCPIMDPDDSNGGSRQVYLPRPDSWYPFNLRIDEDPGNVGVPLSVAVEGGSIFSFGARISADPAQFPYITPIYIREGAIIPQIGVRDYVGDWTVNPITLHIYPGKDNWYSMFLDDGVSRSSAPSHLPQYANSADPDDPDAKDEYRQVRVEQTTSPTTRTITLSHIHDNYNPATNIGPSYRLVIWTVLDHDSNGNPIPSKVAPTVKFADKQGNSVTDCSYTYQPELGAIVAEVPIELADGGIIVTCSV